MCNGCLRREQVREMSDFGLIWHSVDCMKVSGGLPEHGGGASEWLLGSGMCSGCVTVV